MARGDLTLFEELSKTLGEAKINFGSDTFKLAFIDNTATPSAAQATPTWSDFSANEVSGTGYTAGGITLTSVTWTESGGTATFDAANATLAQNGAGPDDIYWAILYSSTSTNGDAVCIIDMGGPVSAQAGAVNVNWNASGIFALAPPA